MTEQEMLAKIAALESQVNTLKATTTNDKLSLRVSAKGAVSVYGLGKFPLTLYDGQWERLDKAMPEIANFRKANKAQLTTKPVKAAS